MRSIGAWNLKRRDAGEVALGVSTMSCSIFTNDIP